jgi:NADPH2:quinone reductase
VVNPTTEAGTFRRIAVREFGGPEQLRVELVGDPPHPGPGELLVDVEAAGINYLDVYQRKGGHGAPSPFLPGLEGVGRVRAAGDGAAIPVGSRVAWIDVRGSYASQVIVRAERAILVPEEFGANQALLFQGLTAQYLVAEYRDVKRGDRVLVHSAAGGVGLLLVQWLKHLGAWVAGTTSSDAKAELARAAGADAVIVYGRDYGFLDRLMTLTEGKGVHLAFDGVGAATLVATLKGLALGGTAVVIGEASGPAPAIEPSLLTARATRLAGGSIFTWNADAAELQRRAAIVIDAVRQGWLRIDAGTSYPLDRAAEAHNAIEGRGTTGKLFLVP